ncbi:MAG: M20/M25/M40 family metallo-hydrolase, partial [Alphaproteobacteria bacterium]|nr:M20/M25/M40 family metallo-hydrolase [Alphaproteobacteria bacterium]
ALPISALAINTARFSVDETPKGPPVAVADDPAAVSRLAEAIRIPTISKQAGVVDGPAFDRLHAFLATSFPRVHQVCAPEIVAGHSLLFACKGSDASLKPVLLAAHQDVVPIDPGSESKWEQPPFAGVIANGFVWGRGTLDDKQSMMAILEATERKLAAGWTPARTVYLAFGHDEEVGGAGAAAMAALLKSRGVTLDLVLDEGMAVTKGIVPGISKPVAHIGVAEKGYLSVRVTATAPGGHSSMPTDDNAVVTLSKAITRLVENQHPARIDGATAGMLEALGPHMGLGMRVALANQWLTRPLVLRQFIANPTTAATVRTSTAPTLLMAGTKDNVLPQSASAIVNHRILPGDSIAGVLAHDREVIGDPRVTVEPSAEGREPSAVSPTSGPGYDLLARAIGRTFPDAVIAPGLVLGGTDARNYQPVSTAIYRFTPMTMTPADLPRIHGTNERIGVADYARAIAFYGALLDETSAAPR